MARGPKPGSIWRGRILSRTIVDSKKLSGVGERAALVYVLLLPQHDGEGMIEADGLSMLVGCGRFALAHSWSTGDMDAAREELVGAGLWKVGDGPHGDAALYVGWENHQRLDKIGRGTRLSESETPGNSGETMAQLRRNSGLEEKGREVEDEVEGEVNGNGSGHTLADIRGTFGMAFEEVTQSPATLSPKDLEAAREALELGTCDRFPDLKREFVRTLRGLKSKNLRMSLRAVLNNLGSDWGTEKAANARKTPRPRREGDPFGDDPTTGRPYHPGA